MIKNLKSTKSFHPFGESHIKQGLQIGLVLKEMCHKTVYLFSYRFLDPDQSKWKVRPGYIQNDME